jgi:hypothetical protein
MHGSASAALDVQCLSLSVRLKMAILTYIIGDFEPFVMRKPALGAEATTSGL